MNLPTSIRVGYLDYRLEEWSDNEAVAAGKDGEADKHNRLIRVRTGLIPAEKAMVVLHEVFHAVWDMGDLSEGCTEEKIVTIFGNQMTQVWRDNPAFVAFMSASLQERD